MGAIDLRTEIPGPRSRALLERRSAATPAGLARATEVAVARGRGAVVEDVDGNRLLDFAGGIGMLNVGHGDADVVRAAARQAERLVHVCALVASYEPYVELAELLNEIVPGPGPHKTLLANSGAEAVENAVKLARAFTGRPALIAFEGAYHGRTLLTLSLTSKYGLFKKGFGPFAPEIYRLPFPDSYRRPPGMGEEEQVDWAIRRFDEGLVAHVDPGAVAAIIVEPVQGEAGFRPAPARFLRHLRELCDTHGIVLVVDEVQTGFGRTGKLFAIEHSGVAPDVVVMAKSLGGGFPIAAVTGRAEIMDAAHPGGVGGTFGGSPVACAAALAAVRRARRPEFLERARELGARIAAVLERWQTEIPLVGDARGLGAMRLVELVRDRETREPAPGETLEVIRRAVSHGLLVMRAGLYSNCIRLLPPLTISDDELDEGLAVLEEALRAVDWEGLGERRG